MNRNSTTTVWGWRWKECEGVWGWRWAAGVWIFGLLSAATALADCPTCRLHAYYAQPTMIYSQPVQSYSVPACQQVQAMPHACTAVAAMAAPDVSAGVTAPGACRPIAAMPGACKPVAGVEATVTIPALPANTYEAVVVGEAEFQAMPAGLKESFAKWRVEHLRARANAIEKRNK